jgi:hypothetical protein
MTAQEKLEPGDVVRFTEDFKQWGTIVARKGDFALMRDRDQNVPGITLLDGRGFDVGRPLVEKVQGDWLPLMPGMAIVDGKTLVRFKRHPSGVRPHEPLRQPAVQVHDRRRHVLLLLLRHLRAKHA